MTQGLPPPVAPQSHEFQRCVQVCRLEQNRTVKCRQLLSRERNFCSRGGFAMRASQNGELHHFAGAWCASRPLRKGLPVSDSVRVMLEEPPRGTCKSVDTRLARRVPSESDNRSSFNGIMSAEPSRNSSFEGSEQLPGDESAFQIKDVWADNLEEEFKVIRVVVQKYNWVAMDTEFPGVVARPVGEFRDSNDFQYRMLKCNVDLLRIIQLGITFFDDKGNTPVGCNSTWQFNFKFEINKDMYAQESILLLQNSGIQFQKHFTDGINPVHFAELLMTSGLVLMDNMKWLSFHSGYDFGYLLKVLTNAELPVDIQEFFELLKLFFPTFYDIKYLIRNVKFLGGGLQDVAEQLSIPRVGQQHQAGSDSLLTGMLFFKMRDLFFEGNIDNAKFNGILYGLAPSDLNESFQ